MFSTVCFALPQPLGEITKEQTIERYFNGKTIDLLEGIWTTTDNKYEFAILKNTSATFTDFDYIGVITHSSENRWKKGEIKLLLKKTSSAQLYTGSYYRDTTGMWGTEKKEYGTTFNMSSNNLIECYLPTGIYGLPVKHVFLRTYPAYDSSNITTMQNSGTGFFVSKTLVATNYHVVSGAKEIEVTYQNDTKLPATIVAKDPANDMALLRVNGLENIANPVSIGQSKDIKEGIQVFTAGFPLANELGTRAKISEGIVNSITGLDDDFRMLQVSIPIQPGNSGSPVFNAKGQVIGVITSTLSNTHFLNKQGIVPQNVGYAMKIEYLNNLITILPEEVKLSESMSPQTLDASQIMDIAKQSIVYIVVKK
jgi:S1-C subfamily serine protease